MDKLDQIAAIIEDPFRIYADLSDHQRQVLNMRAQGVSRDEIAELMGISVTTVSTHIQRGLKKTGLDAEELTSRFVRMLKDVIHD